MDEISQQYWENFKSQNSTVTDADFGEAYAFGSPKDKQQQDELAQLVLKGQKTATTSAYDLYEPTETLPKVGQYDIILDSQGLPICITQTLSVRVTPFKQVSAEHARLEGEGDRSLTYWRAVHEHFFQEEYIEEGRVFNEDANCLCEVFKVVYH